MASDGSQLRVRGLNSFCEQFKWRNRFNMLPGYSPVMQAFLGTLFTWGLTACGASLVVIIRGSQVSTLQWNITSTVKNLADVNKCCFGCFFLNFGVLLREPYRKYIVQTDKNLIFVFYKIHSSQPCCSVYFSTNIKYFITLIIIINTLITIMLINILKW